MKNEHSIECKKTEGIKNRNCIACKESVSLKISFDLNLAQLEEWIGHELNLEQFTKLKTYLKEMLPVIIIEDLKQWHEDEYPYVEPEYKKIQD